MLTHILLFLYVSIITHKTNKFWYPTLESNQPNLGLTVRSMHHARILGYISLVGPVGIKPTNYGTWDWTRTSIALRVKETYHLSTHPGIVFGPQRKNRTSI